MAELIQVEFFKLRRKKLIILMLPAALIMPFFALLYFHYFGKTGVEPMMFYKWSAFGFTMFILLPFILGMLSAMLMHDENQYEMQKQLWIVPVSRMGYVLSKFTVILAYSVCFMLLTAAAAILFGMLSGYVKFAWADVLFLFERCMEISVLTALAILPVFAAAVSQKGYLFPVSLTLLYIFAGFLITPLHGCLHPLFAVSVIVSRGGAIPGVAPASVTDIFSALICIVVWTAGALIFANIRLSQRK